MENSKKEAGHTFLARLGKTRLRPGGKRATEWLFSQAKLNAKQQVLEIACNMGTTSIEMAGRFGCHVTGVDMDESVLEKARKNIEQHQLSHLITMQKANASKLPFEDNSFDVVINEAMLTMYANKAKANLLKEYFRVLKPGGKLLTHDIMLLGQENAEEIIENIHQAINVNARPMKKEEWKSLFTEVGFTDITTDNHPMTLMSPRGMIHDEGLGGALKIIGNALKKENRAPFFKMFRTFRGNRHQLNYIAVCSTKPLDVAKAE